jgi:hypothetical protein
MCVSTRTEGRPPDDTIQSAHWRLVPAEGSHGVCDACASALGIMCRVSSRGVIPDQ